MNRHLSVCLGVTLLLVVSAPGIVNGAPSSNSSVNGLHVGLMTASPINLGSWDPGQYKSITKVAKKYNWHIDVAASVPPAQAEQVLTRFATQGDQLVFVTSQDYEKTMLSVAAKQPKTKFIMVTDLSTTNGLPNVAAYAFDWHQFGYLGGAAAALVSKTGKIGLISGQPITPSVKAFASAKKGAQYIDPHAQVTIQYMNDWVDPNKGYQTASTLISNGVDTTFAIGGGTVPGIMRAAANHHTYAIGSYVNEAHYAPHDVPTSILFKFNVAFDDVAKELAAGKFQPRIKVLNVQNGAIGFSHFTLVPHAKQDTQKMQTLLRDIKSGKLHP